MYTVKILGQGMGRVGQHGVLDFLDALGRIMPGLMDKVSIAGNRVDFTVCCLELGVFIGQVFQLGGAYEGEIGRIEEKYAPFAEGYRLFSRF